MSKRKVMYEVLKQDNSIASKTKNYDAVKFTYRRIDVNGNSTIQTIVYENPQMENPWKSAEP